VNAFEWDVLRHNVNKETKEMWSEWKGAVFSDVIPCRSVEVYRRYGCT
jgi:hypothetical protein